MPGDVPGEERSGEGLDRKTRELRVCLGSQSWSMPEPELRGWAYFQSGVPQLLQPVTGQSGGWAGQSGKAVSSSSLEHSRRWISHQNPPATMAQGTLGQGGSTWEPCPCGSVSEPPKAFAPGLPTCLGPWPRVTAPPAPRAPPGKGFEGKCRGHFRSLVLVVFDFG